MLDEGTLVLEGVTLAQVVELVVQVLVDLAVGAVLDEETAEDTEAAHPKDLAVFRTYQHPIREFLFDVFPKSRRPITVVFLASRSRGDVPT